MKNILKLAWRNLWRNKRRAYITIASVFFAVFFCSVLKSFLEGYWGTMKDNTLRTQAGHLQIHKEGYWDEKITDNFLTMEQSMIAQLDALDNALNVSPRLETAAMASFGTVSKGIAVVGLSPEREIGKSNMPIRIIRGEYLTETDDGILIGEGLAGYLGVDVGDTLALIGQGYRGANAAALFPIRGILRMPDINMDNGLAYTTLPAAQNFIDMPDGYSGILIALKSDSEIEQNKTKAQIETLINADGFEQYEVIPWQIAMESLLQMQSTHDGMVTVIMSILYLIVGFGILGTVIMMSNERRREFAMMISLGLSRKRLQRITILELAILTLIGIVIAIVISFPIIVLLNIYPLTLSGDLAASFIEMGMEPIMPTVVNIRISLNQALTIIIFSALTFIYPIRKIRKLNITAHKN